MRLKKLAVCVVAALTLIVGGSAYVKAEEASAIPATPDLRGTWNVIYERYCEPGGYQAGSCTMVITDQAGGVFRGYWDSLWDLGDIDYFNGAVLFSQISMAHEWGDIVNATLVDPNTILGTNVCIESMVSGEEPYCTLRFMADRIVVE